MAENCGSVPLISIITPVYNAEKYIGATIASIINQDYPNWELFLIDDGSTDASSTICDSFSKIDQRIKVYHKSNSGVSDSRNIGLDNSCGSYVVFCDSDDLLFPSFLSRMIRVAMLNNLDIVSCRPRFFRKLDDLDMRVIDNMDWDCYDNNHLINLPDQFFDVAWGKLIRKELIEKNSIRFERELNRGEDTLFISQCTLIANRVAHSENRLIAYRVLPDSLMRRQAVPPLVFQSRMKYHKLEEYVERNNIDNRLSIRLFEHCLSCCINDLIDCASSRQKLKENLRLLRNDSNLWMGMNEVSDKMSTRTKLSFRLIKFCGMLKISLFARIGVRFLNH